jgi:hypothetical protein
MSELSLNTIKTPNDAKLLRNFADGSRAPHSKTFGLLRGKKNFIYPVAKCEAFVLRDPLADKFFQKSSSRFL